MIMCWSKGQMQSLCIVLFHNPPQTKWNNVWKFEESRSKWQCCVNMHLAYYAHNSVKDTKQQSTHTSTWRNLQSKWRWDRPTRWESNIRMSTYPSTGLGVFHLKNVFFVHSTCEGTVVSYPNGLICGWGTEIRFQVSLEPNLLSPMTSHWLWWVKPGTTTVTRKGYNQMPKGKKW